MQARMREFARSLGTTLSAGAACSFERPRAMARSAWREEEEEKRCERRRKKKDDSGEETSTDACDHTN